jgi:transposase
MTRTRKYPEQIRKEAVRLVRAHRDEYDSEWAAITSVASRPGEVQA